MAKYAWAGTAPDGSRRMGAWNATPSGLAALVRNMFGEGWPLLNVWDGEDCLVAGIGPDPDDLADRVWWGPDA